MGTNKQRWYKDKQNPLKLSYIRYYYFTNDFVIIFWEQNRRKKGLNYPKEPEIAIPDVHSKYRTSGSTLTSQPVHFSLTFQLRADLKLCNSGYCSRL